MKNTLSSKILIASLFLSASVYAANLEIENTTLTPTESGTYDNIYIGNSSTSADSYSKLVVSESIELKANTNLEIGNVADSAGTADLIIDGSIYCGNSFKYSQNNTTSVKGYIEFNPTANVSAGWFGIGTATTPTGDLDINAEDYTGVLMKFNLAEDGTSTTLINRSGNFQLHAIIVLDFTNVDLTAGATATSTIVDIQGGSYMSDSNSKFYALINGNYYLLEQGADTVIDDFITINLTDPANWSKENLVYSFNVIPEPSTYAAIFGALTLAFVAYRRRK